MIGTGQVPEAIKPQLTKGKKLCGWTLFWLSSITVLMYLVMGSSQAMKSAFIEDAMSLIPSIVFLVAASVERKDPDQKHPFGFKRFDSLAFLIAATALLSIGAFLAYEAVMALVKMEHPTIGAVTLFGQTFWLGWLMIAVLIYSAIPPVILGRMKMPVAEKLQDKVLFTDAQTQKADWQTALAGIVGIVGIGLGLWWADAAAALFISLSILKDGYANLQKAAAELADGAPRDLKTQAIDEDARRIREGLQVRYPGADIRLRESGRYILAEVVGVLPDEAVDIETLAPKERPWRLAQVAFVPPECRHDP